MLFYQDARKKVIEVCRGLRRTIPVETVDLKDAQLRVLAQEIRADRDYPPFDRAARDGFAVRAADCARPGATLRVIGEVPAGAAFRGQVGAGECVQIMTGAPVPEGADAVVMVEQTHAGKDASTAVIDDFLQQRAAQQCICARRIRIRLFLFEFCDRSAQYGLSAIRMTLLQVDLCERFLVFLSFPRPAESLPHVQGCLILLGRPL